MSTGSEWLDKAAAQIRMYGYTAEIHRLKSGLRALEWGDDGAACLYCGGYKYSGNGNQAVRDDCPLGLLMGGHTDVHSQKPP